MENKVDLRKYYKLLIFVCVGLYSSMMMIKTTFVAEIVQIYTYFNTSSTNASMANTFYFIVYASTQFILAFFMNKLDIKKYLVCTIPLSIIVYLLMIFVCNDIKQVWYLFLVNGFAQAGVVAITKLAIGKYLPSEYISRTNKIYTAGSSFASITVYGVSSFCVGFLTWKVPFIFFSAIFGTMLILFIIVYTIVGKRCPIVMKNNINENKKEIKNDAPYIVLKNNKSRIIFIIIIMFMSFLTNTTLYGINNWIVKYLKDVWNQSESISILISLTMPVVSMIGPIVGITISQKHKNYAMLIFCLYIPSLILSFLMIFLYDYNFILSIIILALLCFSNMCASSANANLFFEMRDQINPGSTSAFNNVTASLAAGIIPTVISSLIENIGWHMQYIFISSTIVLILITLFIINILVKKTNNKYYKNLIQQ